MVDDFLKKRAWTKSTLFTLFVVFASLMGAPLCAWAESDGIAVNPIAPESVFTHGESNIQWIDKPNQATSYEVVSGKEMSPADAGEEGEWVVILQSTDKNTPLEYSARFDNTLKWLNPLSNTWETMDFEVHLKSTKYFDSAQTFYIKQRSANYIRIEGIEECKAWYKIYRHGEKTPMDPGLFTYWCRSLNPGEGVGFVPSDQSGVTLTNAYVTSVGLYDEPYVLKSEIPEHISGSSVKDLSTSDAIKFMGSDWLYCDGLAILDVADPGQGWVSRTHPQAPDWDAHKWGEDDTQITMHDKTIPYSEFIQYRAVTFDVASDGTAKDGICLTYFSEEDKDDGGNYYWEIEFNGILATRTPPHKTLLSSETVRPGDEVSYSVSQSLEEMPQSIVQTMSFCDELPAELEFSSARMLVDGTDVTDTAGELSVDGQTVTYTFNEEGIGLLKYGDEPSLCELEIHSTVRDGTTPGTVIPNVASVDINDDVQETEQVEVTVLGDPAYSLEKTVSQDVVKTDDVVEYRLSVKNTGESDGTNVVLQDTPPGGIEIDPESITVEGLDEGTYEVSCEDNKLTLTLPTFTVQTSFEVSYQAKVTTTEEGQYKNIATLTDDGGRGANDDAMVALGDPVLMIKKSVIPQEGYMGDRVAYTLEVKNVSVDKTEATNVVITDLPDPNVAIDPTSVTVLDMAEGTMREDAQIEATDQTLSITLPSLAPGSGVIVNYEATILETSHEGNVLVNEASAVADGLEPVKDVAMLTVLGDNGEMPVGNAAPGDMPGELLLQKSATTPSGDGTAQVGEVVNFDVAVTNASSLPMSHVVVTDPIPEGLYITGLPRVTDETSTQLDSTSDPNGPRIEVLYETITLSIPELPAGATYHLGFDAYVAEEAPDHITNVATATADGQDEVQATAGIDVGQPTTPSAKPASTATIPQTDVPPVVAVATSSGAAATTVAVLAAMSSYVRRRR